MTDVTDGFSVQPAPDGKWKVHAGDKVIVTESREDADLLAEVPIVHKKVKSQKATEADIGHIRRVVSICTLYRYNSFATRYLDSWLSRETEKSAT